MHENYVAIYIKAELKEKERVEATCSEKQGSIFGRYESDHDPRGFERVRAGPICWLYIQ